MPIANFKTKMSSIVQNDNDNSNSLGKKIEIISTNFKATPTILARDLQIEGTLTSTGLIEIEGHINGTIKGNSVIIREAGSMEGELFAESLNIRGSFEGNIRAKSINISSKAKLTGIVEYQTMSVEDGACIDGKFKQVVIEKA